MLAALILAMACDLDLKRPRLFSLVSPVNLRKFLRPPAGEDVGFFVAMAFSTNAAARDTPFWPLARETRRFVYRCVEFGLPFVLDYFHKDLDVVTKVFGTGRAGARVYGAVMNRMTKARLQMDLIGFAASGSVLTDFTTFAATAGGLTTWNFVGMAPVYSRRHIREIALDALHILRANAQL